VQLVINTFGAGLRKQGERFLVRAGAKELAVSAHKVQSILITTSVSLSSDVLQLTAEHNIDVVFLDRFGEGNPECSLAPAGAWRGSPLCR
jgi:CRISPR-associated protein Cas1